MVSGHLGGSLVGLGNQPRSKALRTTKKLKVLVKFNLKAQLALWTLCLRGNFYLHFIEQLRIDMKTECREIAKSLASV